MFFDGVSLMIYQTPLPDIICIDMMPVYGTIIMGFLFSQLLHGRKDSH